MTNIERHAMRQQSPGEQFYTREVAAQYENLRKDDRYWLWENEIVERYLHESSDVNSVADCPVGTGRFFDIYSRFSFPVVGIDISEDMLAEAKNKVPNGKAAGRYNLIKADVSKFSGGVPVASDLICFRLLHLISEDNLDDLVAGLSAISSRRVLLQQFTVKDYNIRRMARRLLNAICSEKIGAVRKLKYLYRTLRALIELPFKFRKTHGFKHKKNTFCDVTYSHRLSRVLREFARHGFFLRSSYDCLDKDHFMGESACYLSMIVSLEKAADVGR